MCALVIRDDISPEDLRRRVRQESDGRVAARLIAITNALEGMDRASATSENENAAEIGREIEFLTFFFCSQPYWPIFGSLRWRASISN